MPYKTWTDEDLKSAVKSSTTKSEVIKKIGLKPTSSGNFQTVDAAIKRLSLDISHFKEVVFGKPPTKEWDIKDILIENSPYTSTQNLKKKLLKLGLLESKCYGENCGITEWYGQKLSLQLDHINGDRSDNRIENLRLLCPNCHSLTPTFCRGKTPKKEFRCPDCNVVVQKQNARCQKCAGSIRRNINQKTDWPNTVFLNEMVRQNGSAATGRQLGVSDNAVRKRIEMRVVHKFTTQQARTSAMPKIRQHFPQYIFDDAVYYYANICYPIVACNKDSSEISEGERVELENDIINLMSKS